MYKQASLLNGALMQLDPTPKSYCDCWSYGKSQKSTSECKCGDEDSRELEWVWRPSEHPTVKVTDEVSVMFHPVYSQGTGIVRGDSPLQAGRHHFWEIKMTSTVCGTDLMIGVGTEKVDLLANKYRFASALGLDTNSWGYSYRGIAQHDNESKFYGKKFGTGSIVSCHLDLFRGTIEFYMNRMPLGVAFRNLPVDGSHVYYPMVSSTAAKSSVKLLNASSFPECLQYQTMRAISRHPGTLSQLRGLPTGFRYKDQLWYLQRTEKFIYNVEALRKDPIFDQRTGFEGDDFEGGHDDSAGNMPPPPPDIDIYGGIDEEVFDIMEQRQQQEQCRLDNNPDTDEVEGDDDIEMVLFSYFCDHFA